MLIYTHLIEKKCINWPIWYISSTKTKHAAQLREEEGGGVKIGERKGSRLWLFGDEKHIETRTHTVWIGRFWLKNAIFSFSTIIAQWNSISRDLVDFSIIFYNFS